MAEKVHLLPRSPAVRGLALAHDGHTYDLVPFDQFGGSPVEAAALHQMAGLLERQWANTSSLGWNDPVASLWFQGELCAAIVYRLSDHSPAAFIVLGWTEAAWRRRGLYSLLFREFARVLKGRHPALRRIESGYHVDNAASAAMHRALGRRVVAVSTEFDLGEVQ